MSEAIRSIEAFSLPPDDGGAAKAFSRIGYELADALADLIDNSLDAEASRVEITFHRDDTRIFAVTVADNGHGMADRALREAMRFAAPVERRDNALGVFGLGMKSASLSQCRSLTVLTRACGPVVGCRWSVESIKDHWRCEVLDPVGAAVGFEAAYFGSNGAPSTGTVVLWERLDRMSVAGGEQGLDAFLGQLMEGLGLKLGLVFHRFLGPKFGIVLRAKHRDRTYDLPRRVRPYDPFGYPKTGRAGYPKAFRAPLGDDQALTLTAHIWPAQSASPEFLLGRRRATPHQGFYFYRNSRLIQAGGWNGVVRDGSDAELSLARVAIDLPPTLVDTNVQKSAVQTTASLSQALRAAKSGPVGFEDYLADARRTYRAGRRRAELGRPVPVVPGAGIPVGLQRSLADLLGGKGPVREIAFVWESLPKRKIFEVEAEADRIVLNRKYRQQLLGSSSASSTDAPLAKLLFFLLLENELDRSRASHKQQEWLERCNKILLAFVSRK
ncbi:ATP-binding protein [Xanthobacter sediminis]